MVQEGWIILIGNARLIIVDRVTKDSIRLGTKHSISSL